MNTNKEDLLQCVEEAVSAETKDENLILTYFQDCAQLGLEILPCDINTSQAACAFEGENRLHLGLSVLIPGQEQFVNDILGERQKEGMFRSFQNFCERLDLDQIPSEFFPRLIEGGAFDSTGESRSRLFKGYTRILQGVRKAKADQASQQISLFALAPAVSKVESIPIELPKADEWTEEERIDHERQVAGFSFTAYLQQQADTEEKEKQFEDAYVEEDERVEGTDVPDEEETQATSLDIQEPVETAAVEPLEPTPTEVPHESLESAPAEAPQEEPETSPETKEQSEPPSAEIPWEEPDEPEPLDQEETPPLPPEEFSAEEYEAIYAEEEEQQQQTPDENSEFQVYADYDEEIEQEASPQTIVIQFGPTVTEDTLYQLRHLLEHYRGNVHVMLEFMGDGAPATLVKTHPDYAVDISESFMKEVKQLVGEESIRFLDEEFQSE